MDYGATGELASALIGELQAAYLRLPQRRREILLGLINAHRVAMRTAKDLGARGLPMVAVRAVQQCAEALEDPAWRWDVSRSRRGYATGELDRAGTEEVLVARVQPAPHSTPYAEGHGTSCAATETKPRPAR